MNFNSIKDLFPNVHITDDNVVLRLNRGQMTANGATPWYTEIEVGTPGQTLKVMVDTGTTHTWLTAQACKTDACNAHNKFNLQDSDTYQPEGDPEKPVMIDFGPWGQLLAVLGADSIEVNRSVNIKLMRFYLANYYDGSQFRELACDGGLSIPAVNPIEPKEENSSLKPLSLNRISYTDSDQILDKLSSVIGNQVASFGFDNDKKIGFCVFGKIDIAGQANTLPVVKSGTYYMLWTVCLQSLEYNKQEVLNNVNFILDTGSSRFKGDPKYITKIVNQITDSGRLPSIISDKSQLTEYKNINLLLNGQVYTLTPENYFLKVKDGKGGTEYHLGFHPMDGMENYLLVGSVFLDSVISNFNYEESTVTLYKTI